jgi:hypothetical protein
MATRENKGMERRDFLRCAALAGGAAAFAGLSGCAPTDDAGTSTAGGGSGTSATSKYAWENPPQPITDIAETKDFDVVVVGAGIAGISACEAAARNGAKVAVVEQMAEYSIRGVDNGSLNNSWQKENGIQIPEDTAARLLYLWSQQSTNYNLIKTWATRSGGVFDYLRGLTPKYGFEMVQALSPTAKYGWEEHEERWRVYPDAVSFISTDDVGMMTKDNKWVNDHLAHMLVSEATENGAEFFYNNHAEQLVTDASGAVTGVITTDETGAHVQYNASKGVIMATGDIGGNEDMIEYFCPIVKTADANLYTPPGANKGEGLIMGMWAGAAHSKSPAAPMIHQFKMESITLPLTSFAMCWPAVNRNGERYGAEMPFEPYLTNARLNTPGSIAWSIFDADYPKYVQAQFPTTYETVLDGLPEMLAEYVDKGIVLKADTLAELAGAIGVPADAFEASIKTYNQWLPAGEDKQYGVPPRFLSQVQTPPFYATANVACILTIPFGLHVNDDSQVCKQDDTPIPGLFAVGNVQGDFFGLAYPVHCPGISNGRSITFGQLVGEALAKDTVITKTA